MKHKHGEQWDVIDIDTRNFFESCTLSMIKFSVGINYYGESIKCIDKSNTS